MEWGPAWAKRLREAWAARRLQGAQRHRTAWNPGQRLEQRLSERAGQPPPGCRRPLLRARLAPARRAPPPGRILLPSAASPASPFGLGPEAEQKAAAEPAAWRAISPARAWAPAAAAAAAASRAPTCRSPGVRAPAGGAGETERGRAVGGGGRESPHTHAAEGKPPRASRERGAAGVQPWED